MCVKILARSQRASRSADARHSPHRSRCLHRGGGADGRARRGVGELLRGLGAFAEADAAARRASESTSRPVARSWRRVRSSATKARLFIGQSDPEAAAAFAADLAPDWPALQGVVGAPAACEAFARTLAASAPAAWQSLRVRLRQHALTAVADVPAAPGAPRVADEADIAVAASTRSSRSSSRSGIPDSPERVRDAAADARRARRFLDLGRRRPGRPSPASTMPRPISRGSPRCTRFPTAAAAATRRRWSRRCRASCSRAASAGSFSRPTSRTRRRTRSTRGSASCRRPTNAHFDFVDARG